MNEATEATLEQLRKFGNIVFPKDVDEPILAPTVARSVYEWLIEINSREALRAAKVEPRRLALLYGPPGTGKTTLAHHVAARLGLPMVSIQSERLIDKYMGSTGRNVAELFTLLTGIEGQCVLFLDEFDALAPKRGRDDSGPGSEMDRVIAVLLQRVEAFKGFGLAATNTKDVIDPALWRRFGLQIAVDLPGPEQRFAIIRKYALPYELEDEAIDRLVDATRGCSPSLLRQLMEGMKRSLILGPKLKLNVDDPVAVFAGVVVSVAPPPEMTQPPLWSEEGALDSLAGIKWPPVKGGR